MADNKPTADWDDIFWYRGKVTRRRLIGYGAAAGALGACMLVFEEYKIVNMIGVCLDTTITTTKCNRYTFRTFDYAPAQAVAFAPYLVNKLGKRWHIAYADYAWGQSTRDAYIQEIKKAGGDVVETTGIPLGT